MESVFITTRKQRIIREMRDYMMIALGMLMYSIGWTVLLLPNDITTGGVPGIASIVYWATGVNVQYTYFAINGALLVASLIILGWKFSVKTVFAVFTMTTILPIIQGATAGLHLLHDQPFMACVIGASFCGGGIGVAFSANGSSGGTDIVAAIINKYRDITLGRVILMTDMVIISSSYLVLHDWEKVVYGFANLGHRINKDLHRGVTFIDGVGCYTGAGVKMMFVLAKKRESTTIFRLIKDIDPNAFVSQSAVIGVFGEGFDRIKVK